MNCISKIKICFLGIILTACTHVVTHPSVEAEWLDLVGSKWTPQNPGKSYSMNRVQMEGRESLRFEIRQGEVWIGPSGSQTFRSEINTNEFVPMYSENWYRVSIYLPSDFLIEDNRLCLAQWWAKTKTHLGEVHRSPILQLRYANGALAILLRRYPTKVTTDDESYIQTRLFDTNIFALGQWHDFVFHIKWSPENNGYIEAWWNNHKIINFKGITQNQDEVGPTFKFGLYRDDSPKTYISYISGVRRGTSPESIGFDVP